MMEYNRKIHKRIINIETISENLKIISLILFFFSPAIIFVIGILMNTELFKRFIAVYFITVFFIYILSELYTLAVLNLTFGKDKKWLFLYDDIDKIMEKLEKDVEKENIPKKDFKEALYIRSKYYFEDEVPEIIK